MKNFYYNMVNVYHIQPHSQITQYDNATLKVFLAGTIDMGNSIDWQSVVVEKFKEMNDGNIYIFNPRRTEGFSNEQEELEYQINWELQHLEEADLIIMNLLPNSKSPISLLELGLFARSKKLIVICPEEFYRYTNVKITCEKYGVKLLSTLNEFFES